MSKYIKLEDATERLNQLYHGYEVEEWLESLPAIDIVHCAECKFKGFCDSIDDWNFCFWGEREGEEE